MLCRIARLLVSLAVVVLLIALTAGAQDYVAPGSDYLLTGPGTSFDMSARGFSTNVVFKSNPSSVVCTNLNTCTSDTIIQRQQDADLTNPAPIPIQIIYLSLCSQDPAGGPCYGVPNNNGHHYVIYATLDPRALPNNTGTMTITGDTSGGTFSSRFTVNLLATFVTTDGGPNLTPFRGSFTVQSSESPPPAWTSTEPMSPPYFAITAPYPAQQANVNTNFPRQPQPMFVNFFPVTFFRELHFGGGVCHVVSLACVGGILVARPPNIALFWLICFFLQNNNGSLDQIADFMLPPDDFGAIYTQNASWDRVQEPAGHAPVGASGAARLPHMSTAAVRN